MVDGRYGFTEAACREELGEYRVGMRCFDQHHQYIALYPQELSGSLPASGTAGMVTSDIQYACLVLDELCQFHA